MPNNKRCKDCNGIILGMRGQHSQTRYCVSCAKINKRRNTLDPWTPEERREYMREYMRRYRRFRNGINPIEGVA
jgi:hypothetical protein